MDRGVTWGLSPFHLFTCVKMPFLPYTQETTLLQHWRGHIARTPGQRWLLPRRLFKLMIWKTSLSPVYLALCLTWDVIFYVHLGWDQGCHPTAPNDGKSTLSLGTQLSRHCITLLHKNARRISSVGFSDFQLAAREFSHASGSYIKDSFYIRVFHSMSPLITY